MVNIVLRPAKVWKSDPYAFSQGVRSEGKSFVFVAGQAGIDPSGQIVSEDVSTQTKQSFENMRLVLQEAGATFENVTKLTVYLTNIDDLHKYSEVMASYFPKGFPAQTAVEVNRLALPSMKVEVESVAIV